jgi:hypothetical protein
MVPDHATGERSGKWSRYLGDMEQIRSISDEGSKQSGIEQEIGTYLSFIIVK